MNFRGLGMGKKNNANNLPSSLILSIPLMVSPNNRIKSQSEKSGTWLCNT